MTTIPGKSQVLTVLVLAGVLLLGEASTGAAEIVASLDFPSADAAFDVERGVVYLTWRQGRAIRVVDLETGALVAAISSEYRPERMALSASTRRLFVALLVRDHDPGWWEEDQRGFLAEVDLDAQVKIRELEIPLDPYDLVLAGDHVIVSSGSGQWTGLHSYRIGTGEVAGQGFVRQLSRLGVHPSGTGLYVATTDLFPSNIEKYAVDSGTGALEWVGPSPYHGGPPMDGNVFVHPEGEYFVTRGGGVFTSSEAHEEDMRHITTLERGLAEGVAFDATRHAIFTVAGSRLCFYNDVTFVLVGTEAVPVPATYVTVAGERLYVISPRSTATVLSWVANPAAGGESNTPPVPDFTWSPGEPDALAPIRFDAAATTDAQDSLEGLRFRWDWESDGEYDTDFLTVPSVEHIYELAGVKRITLQVKDSLGLLADVTLELFVSPGGDPGNAGPVFELQYRVSDALFDPSRNALYVIREGERALMKLDVQTGSRLEELLLEGDPTTLALSPDGGSLYVGLVMEPTVGAILELDLDAWLPALEVPVESPPFDLVVAGGAWLVASTGYGDVLRSYSLESLEKAGEAGARDSLLLTAHPSQTAIYGADTRWSPPDIWKVALDPATGELQALGDSRYHGGHPMQGPVFAHPDGTRLITRDGAVYTSSDLPEDDRIYIERLSGHPFDDALFDGPRKALFTVGEGRLCWHNLESLLLQDCFDVPADALWLGLSGEWLYVASLQESSTRVSRIHHPALGAEGNEPPLADFDWNPPEPDTDTIIAFSAELSRDPDEPLENLLFRWDWESDGVWDTDFVSDPVIEHRFDVAGTKLVQLEVRDSFGLTDRAGLEVLVALAEGSVDPAVPHSAFDLPFEVTDAVFHPFQASLFVIARDARLLVQVDGTTGFVEKRVELEHEPLRLRVRPDGLGLYIGQVPRGASDYRGYLAEVALPTCEKLRDIGLDVEPQDFLVTDSGWLIISPSRASGSTDVMSYRLDSGEKVSQVSASQRQRLALHPSQTRIYGVEKDFSSKDIVRYELDPTTGDLTWMTERPLRDDYAFGNQRVSPDGTVLVTSPGNVFALADERQDDLEFTATLEERWFDDAAFDAPRSGLFTVQREKLSFYNSESFLLVRSYVLPSDNNRFVGASADWVYAVSPGERRTLVSRVANPARGGEANTAPQADFSWTPLDPVTSEPVVFDATGSGDAEDSLGALHFRWDWESDGTFDTVFDPSPVVQHQWEIAGTKRVTLQVRDSLGLMELRTARVDVLRAEEPPDPMVPHPAFEIFFEVSDAVFDPARGHLHATGRYAERLVTVDLQTGLTLREHAFDAPARTMASTPDLQRMYVGLDTNPGRVVEFDLETGGMTREILIDARPFDLVATDHGYLVVSPAGGDWTETRCYRAETGEKVGEVGSRHFMRLALHPSQKAVYAVTTDLSPTDLAKHGLDPATGALVGLGRDPYHGGVPMGWDVFIHPGGQYLVSRRGIFTSSDVPAEDRQHVATLEAEEVRWVAFDAPRGALFTVGLDDLCLHDAETFELVQCFTIPAPARFVGVRGPWVYAISVRDGQGRSDVSRVAHPLWEGGETAAFIRADTNQDAATNVTDAVVLLRYLFSPEIETLACPDASDSNDDGTLDLSDVLHLLNFLFLPSPEPQPPWGPVPAACGPDPTPDALGCEDYAPCQGAAF